MEIETEIRKFWKLSQTKDRPSKIMGLKEQLIYNDLKQLHKIRYGKSTIEFADFFTITNLQMRTTKRLRKRNLICPSHSSHSDAESKNTGTSYLWKLETWA